MLSRREMGALCASLLFCLLLSLGAGWAQSQLTTADQLAADTLRLHIRADTDSVRDQSAKLAVRDAVLALTVPYPGIVLRSGSVGGCVRLVQQKLNTEGERLTTDGKFGASTVAAVKRYQTRHSLTSDGSVGKDTWEKMFPAA